MVVKKIILIVSLLTLLAFGLRIYRLGEANFKEEEFSTVKASAYLYYCWQDDSNCYEGQPTSFMSRFLALLQNNETVPNLITRIYLWDWVKDQASPIHFSRTWPYLFTVAETYRWLGISEFSSRLPSAIWGSLLIPAGFIFARHFGGSVGLSLIYSFLLAVAFPLIDISRHSRMYSMFAIFFLLAVYFWHRLFTAKKPRFGLLLGTAAVTLLAYWLQSLTLLLLVGIYVYAAFKSPHWFWLMSFGLISVWLLSIYWSVDFFHRYFLGIISPPHWQYLSGLFGLVMLLMVKNRQGYLLTITAVYLAILIFFTRPSAAAAYILALWPISLWPLLSWRRWLAIITTIIVLAQFLRGVNYLYFGRDDRAQITAAYPILINNYQPGDKIYAVQLRDYYLQDLPPETPLINLQENPNPDFSGSGFVVWEKEKEVHFQPEVIGYIKSNFNHLAGEGLDNFQVEIYSFGK